MSELPKCDCKNKCYIDGKNWRYYLNNGPTSKPLLKEHEYCKNCGICSCSGGKIIMHDKYFCCIRCAHNFYGHYEKCSNNTCGKYGIRCTCKNEDDSMTNYEYGGIIFCSEQCMKEYITIILLTSREYIEESLFNKDYLPLDMLKLIFIEAFNIDPNKIFGDHYR